MTNWEVGNHILCRICDELMDFSKELNMDNNNPELQKELTTLAHKLKKKWTVPLMSDKSNLRKNT